MSVEINIRGRRAKVSVGNMTDMLEYGVYDVWADADVSIIVGSYAASTAENPENDDPLDVRLNAADGYKIIAGNTVSVRISNNGDVIGGSGTFNYMKVD